MNFEAKPFAVVLLFGLLLFAFFGLAIFFDMGIAITPPKTQAQANMNAYNQEALKADATGIFEVDLTLAVLPPSSSQEQRELEIQGAQDLRVYARDDSQARDIAKVCVDWIDMVAEGSEIIEFHSFLTEPVCHEIDDRDVLQSGNFISDIVNGENQTFPVENYYDIRIPKEKLVAYQGAYPEIIGQNFWFPYDKFNTTINIQVSTTTYLDDGMEIYALIPAYYDWRLRPSGSRAWDIKIQNSLETLDPNNDFSDGWFWEGPYQKVSLQFVRPILFRISFPLMIIAMAFFIALVPMMKNASVDGILGVMAGLLFATFAIRSILSPGQEIGQTLVDVGIIGLNILQIFAAAFLFIRIYKQRREAKI